ncbi:MAG: transcriptional repressor [Planctomycetota bacterium]
MNSDPSARNRYFAPRSFTTKDVGGGSPSGPAQNSQEVRQCRKTRQRQVIIEELQAVTSHPTAAELYELVRPRLPRVSLGTVYRNLDLLARMGLIEKLEHSGGEARFDANTAEHDHLRCVRCGRVDDVRALPLDLARPEEDDLRGYEILGHHLEFLGICLGCRQSSQTKQATK